ncbi:hypothetical protein SDC9_114136 [bioreactor metagenome]|uniref:Uncharacterized protein n=1 Tax=bioreactor metagenome TaxID=1076179 RepID=A0A645BP17_9ZZZZ
MIGAHSVIPYPDVKGNPIFRKKASASLLKAAPPTITSLNFPPKVLTNSWLIFFCIFWSTTGNLNSIRIDVFVMIGWSFFLYIFSMINGTEIMISGLISAKASIIILGLGILVRKCTCAPTVISKRNSNIMPYIWAVGSIATTLDVLLS